MAQALKLFFNREVISSIAKRLATHVPDFPVKEFTGKCLHGLDKLELTARGWHIAHVMHEFLPQPFARAAQALTANLDEPLPTSGVNGMSSFFYLPHVFYVAKYGLDDLEASLQAQYLLTQRFTAEVTIRGFIMKYPEETYARLEQWATDPNVHVRRLVSEGTRPRLPWAPRLKPYQQDPSPVLALLEKLKDDPERYVQRSVANNLNDIAKDHPQLVVEVCKRWAENATPGRQWIVQHAMRSLVKQGSPQALELLGVGSTPEVDIAPKQLPKAVTIGDKLTFDFELRSTAKKPQTLQVDYRVHFVKANGTTQAKVFKLRRVILEPKQTLTFRTSVSFAELTTRKPYPGAHSIELFVNGVALPLGSVLVRPAR